MKRLGMLVFLALAGCKTTEPTSRIVYKDLLVPTPVYCITADKIPAEPAKVGSQLTGNAAQDIGPISISAKELRKALTTARALLLACVKP